MRLTSCVSFSVLALTLGLAPAAYPGESDAAASPGTRGDSRSRRDLLVAQSTIASAPRPAAASVTYVPPMRGAPSLRVIAGTRGAAWKGSLVVLAPDHVAWTVAAQPTLYWFVSEAVESPVEIVVLDDVSVDPLLELRLEPPVEAGVHAVDLGARGAELAAGRAYRWSVSIVHDPGQRSRDTYAEGGVELVEPPASLREGLARARLEGRARAYAEAGYWYDALDTITELIEARKSQAGRWRAERLALLGQVGIDLAGAF